MKSIHQALRMLRKVPPTRNGICLQYLKAYNNNCQQQQKHKPAHISVVISSNACVNLVHFQGGRVSGLGGVMALCMNIKERRKSTAKLEIGNFRCERNIDHEMTYRLAYYQIEVQTNQTVNCFPFILKIRDYTKNILIKINK